MWLRFARYTWHIAPDLFERLNESSIYECWIKIYCHLKDKIEEFWVFLYPEHLELKWGRNKTRKKKNETILSNNEKEQFTTI